MKVVFVKNNGKVVSVGAGIHCFSIKDNQVQDNQDQRFGSRITGTLKQYEEAFELAKIAWEMQECDSEENH